MKLFTLLLVITAVPGLSQFSTGFKSITRFDSSRPPVEKQGDKEHGRIIQINVWYPSQKTENRMTFRDYVGLAGLELDSSLNNDWYTLGLNRYFSWPESVKFEKKKFIDFIEREVPMNASKNAPGLVEKFPLIILVHGYAADYAFVAEKLASNGFVVMHVPVKGTLQTELDYQEKGLESQVLDYEYGLCVLKSEFPVFTNEIGVAGFSFGGQSAVAIALRNNNVKAIVSLDGGIGSAFGAQLLRAQSFYDVKKLNQPLLHLYNARDSYADLSWIKAAPQRSRWLVAMKNMEHGHFTSFGMLNSWLPGIMGKDAPDPGRGYEAVMELTGKFFTRLIKNKMPVNENFFAEVMKKNGWIKKTIEKSEFIS
ncbi:MAG: dienelactone hydrolase family protein [Chitinophagaceae bacterium]|nr:dienelactone hydrolase family protein [Chitinophagaceae bacterium]